MSESQFERYKAARFSGVSSADYAKLLQEINDQKIRRGSASVSQVYVKAALEDSNLAHAQKRAIWESYGWKTESPW